MIHSVPFVLEVKSRFFVKILVTESQMTEFGRQLGVICRTGCVVFLQGTLGMGKTTLSRSIVQGLGWEGKVKSPTYTLVEQYALDDVDVYHFDLYRLADPEELEFMGIRDFDTKSAIWLVEWPEKGHGMLPNVDLQVTIDEADSDDARIITLSAHTQRAEQQLNQLKLTANDGSIQ